MRVIENLGHRWEFLNNYKTETSEGSWWKCHRCGVVEVSDIEDPDPFVEDFDMKTRQWGRLNCDEAAVDLILHE